MESSCFLLKEENGKDTAIFTGDTLFIGDVGRPDLAQKTESEITQEHLAGLLFDSLRNKIMPLADDIIVYPAHGAGSACGKNMSKETSDTLGHQKKVNYALQSEMTKDAFIKEVTDGLNPPPAYFPINVELNRIGYDSFDSVLARGSIALSVEAFEAAMKDDALLLDTRKAQEFAKAFIPGAINIGLDGSFAPWVGTLIPYKKQAEELLKAIDSINDYRNNFASMLTVYKKQQLKEIENLFSKAEFGLESNLDVLLYNRNKNWVKQFATIFPSKSVFVAVGSGYLVGEKGVIELLRKEGYTLRPVANNITSQQPL